MFKVYSKAIPGMMEIDPEQSAADLVMEHPEIAQILDRLHIEYSCGGRSLAYLCRQRDLDVGFVVSLIRDEAGNQPLT